MMTLLESGPHIREQLEGLAMSSLVDVLSWLADLLVPKELPSTRTPSTLTHSSCYTPSHMYVHCSAPPVLVTPLAG